MKKKLLLMAVLVAVLVCVFTVSAFAADVVEKTEDETYGTVIKLNGDPGLDNAAQYVSTLKKINDAGTDKNALCIVTDGTYYYVFPSSYIVLERADGKFDLTASDLATAMAEFNTAKGTSYYADYSIVNGTGAAKRLEAIARFEFTSDVTSVSDSICCFRSYPYLVEVRFKYAINLSAGDLFRDSKVLKTVVGYEKATSIGNSAFMGCSTLESVSLPTNTTRIPSKAFWGCKVITISNLSELTQLTTIGSSAFQDTGYLNFVLPDTVTTIEANAFQSAFKDGDGGSFVINRTSQLTTIGASAFEDCRKMPKNVYIPSTVTSIGAKAFTKCYTLETLENFENCQITTIQDGTFQYVTNLKTIKIPESVTTIGTAFADNNYLTLVYIPSTVTSIADTFTGGKPTSAVFVYTGTSASALSACSKIAGANVIQASVYNPSTSYPGINLVVGYSRCIVYNNGNHEDISVTLDFKSFYEAIGVANTCACGVSEKGVDIPAIFACPGFSIPEDASKFGISITYNVNTKAYAKYEELSGNTVEYGIYAVLEERLGSDAIIDENGVASEVAKLRYIDSKNVARYDFIINGFNTPEYQALNIAMGTFVKVTDKDGVAKYSLLQAKTPESGNYYFVTYNAVKAGQ